MLGPIENVDAARQAFGEAKANAGLTGGDGSKGSTMFSEGGDKGGDKGGDGGGGGLFGGMFG